MMASHHAMMIRSRVESTNGTWNGQLSVSVMSPDGGVAEKTLGRKTLASDGKSRGRIRAAIKSRNLVHKM